MLNLTVLSKSKDQGNMKYVSFPWPQLEAALSVFILSLFLKNHFWEGINKNKENCYQCQIINFLKCPSWRYPFSRSWCRKQTLTFWDGVWSHLSAVTDVMVWVCLTRVCLALDVGYIFVRVFWLTYEESFHMIHLQLRSPDKVHCH